MQTSCPILLYLVLILNKLNKNNFFLAVQGLEDVYI